MSRRDLAPCAHDGCRQPAWFGFGPPGPRKDWPRDARVVRTCAEHRAEGEAQR